MCSEHHRVGTDTDASGMQRCQNTQERRSGEERSRPTVVGRWNAGSGAAHRACCDFGSLTLVSQKSLMLLTRLSNASNSTGLLR